MIYIGIVASLAVSILVYVFYSSKLRFKEIGLGYKHSLEKPIESKPCDWLSLEEYVALSPKRMKTAGRAILLELDRQGKIQLAGAKFERLPEAELSEAEKAFLFAMSKYSTYVELKHFLLDGGRADFIDPVDIIRENAVIKKSLVEKGLIFELERKVEVPYPWTIVAIAFISTIVIGMFSASSLANLTLWTSLMMYAVTFLAPVVLGLFLMLRQRKFDLVRRYTPKGVRVLEHYDGLKRYIKHVEKGRLAFFQDKKESEFAELTPYAALFGMEKTWTKKLRRYSKVLKVG
jgi:hypothetical protein